MLTSSRIGAAFVLVGGVIAAVAFGVAFFKSGPPRNATSDPTSGIPQTPATSSSVASPQYDVVVGVGGIAPIQTHPDTNGTSIAPTNPN
jgi:hypothetical protein